MNKIVSENPEQVIKHVSDSIIALAKECISQFGQFTIALSGGNTPKLLYNYLIKENCFDTIDLSKTFIYFSDERYVSHDDDRSNYGLAREYLLNHLNIPDSNVFPVNTSFADTSDSVKDYQNTIITNIGCNKDKTPEFDLIILGMGTDGHTASLFPESNLVFSDDTLISTCYHKDSKTDRISFTFPLINAAKNIYILAIGKEKFPILDDIKKTGENKRIKYPIQYVQSQGELLWFLDIAADKG